MVGRPPLPVASVSNCFRRLVGARPISSASNNPDKGPPPESSPSAEKSEAETRMEAYRQVQNLDFMTAAKILFTAPPKRKKFGLDFHLVQLFFVCMPSLAVYLVAQYARHEIKRMEAEVEEKKKQVEKEEKAKQAEMGADNEGSDTVLAEVKIRLDVLEEAVKEIVEEKKKTSPSSSSKDQEEIRKTKPVASADKKNDTQTQLKVEQANRSSKDKSSGSNSASSFSSDDK